MLYGLNILSNYDKNYTGVISIDGEKMNKVDYLDMPVAYAMDQPIFFTHDILKNLQECAIIKLTQECGRV